MADAVQDGEMHKTYEELVASYQLRRLEFAPIDVHHPHGLSSLSHGQKAQAIITFLGPIMAAVGVVLTLSCW